MGFLDTIKEMAGERTGMAGGQDQGNQGANGTVASGMMQALEEHPGGLSGIMESFRNQGMSGSVDSWSKGEQSSATPDQIQQGLGNTGFIEKVAAKAGVSPEVAKVAMAVVLPMALAHFTKGGQEAPPQSGYGSMATQLLSKLI